MSFPNKICRDCHAPKPFGDFYAAPEKRDGLSSYCKPCHKRRMAAWREKNKEKQARAVAAWKKKHPEYKQAESRKRQLAKYGLTPETYNALSDAQGGVCALCALPEEGRRLAVDHCHDTGRVRGLLCTGCNTSLGKLGDNLAALRRVVAYLEAS